MQALIFDLDGTLRDKLIEYKHYVCKHGDDMPEIAGSRWGQKTTGQRCGRGQRCRQDRGDEE